MIWEVEEADRNSWGVIVNGFKELECEYVAALEALHKKAKAWCVGPMIRVNHVPTSGGWMSKMDPVR